MPDLEYPVRTPDGLDYGRDADLSARKLAADRLGVGTTVEQLDESLCRTGVVIYRVSPESLSPAYDLFNDWRSTLMSDTISTKAAAEHCETTPRVLRQFLRASEDYEAVGSGGRYAFESDDLPELKTRFDVWVSEREAAAKARAEKDAAEKATPAEGDDVSAEDKSSEEPAKPGTRSRKPAA